MTEEPETYGKEERHSLESLKPHFKEEARNVGKAGSGLSKTGRRTFQEKEDDPTHTETSHGERTAEQGPVQSGPVECRGTGAEDQCRGSPASRGLRHVMRRRVL